MSLRKKYSTTSGFIKHFDFIISDFLILEISYILGMLWYAYAFEKPIKFNNLYKQQAIILLLCLIVTFTISHPYKNILKRDKWQEIAATFKHAAAMAMMDIVLMYLLKEANATSRLTFVATWAIYFVLETTFRLFWKRLIRDYIIHHRNSRRQDIVLTSRDRSKEIEDNLGIYILRDYDITGVFFSDYQKERDEGEICARVPVMGGIEDMVEYATHNWVDEVILDLQDDQELALQLEDLFSEMGITTHHTVALLNQFNMDSENKSTFVEKLGNYIVVTHETREIAEYQIVLKRLLDLLGGLIGSFIAVVIIAIVGPMIKRKSPGPVIFKQERVGKNGKTFKMYKIRSMYMDAEERKTELMAQNKMDGLMFKIDDDPRIIGSEKKDKDGKPKGIGNFIRSTSLDEFPQFFNVLKGDMSIVGTRPPTVDEWNQYSPQHRKRLSIKPGITGLWQISGRSKITNFDEVVSLDLDYIDSWTVALDIRIICKTIAKVLRRDGAE